ncbi:MAG: protein phosphatase 2C domain-containing protein, partial [Candidatus Hydrogenedentota bacterium]
MRLDIAAASDIGRRKKENEDSFGVFLEDSPENQLFDDGALLVVADGLGGHMGGEIASKLAVSIVKDVTKETVPQPDAEGDSDGSLLELLER